MSDSGTPVFVVLGAHRSGTSLCSHVMQALGIDMSGDPRPDEHNGNGYWERWEIVELHDELLRLLNRNYIGLEHDLPMPFAWWTDPAVRSIRARLMDVMRPLLASHRYVGFKDPRTARLLPLWHEIFRDLGVDPQFVISVRNPAQTARSINTRDGIALARGEYRWLVYYNDIFRHTRGHPMCVIQYEDWFRVPVTNLRKLSAFLPGASDRSDAESYVFANEIVDAALRHDEYPGLTARDTFVRSFYRALRRYDDAPSFAKQTHDLVEQVSLMQQLIRPLEATVHERISENSRLVQTSAAQERTLGALRGLLARRDEEIESLRLHIQDIVLEAAVMREGIESELRATRERAQSELSAIRERFDGDRADARDEREKTLRAAHEFFERELGLARAHAAELESALGAAGERNAELERALAAARDYTATLQEERDTVRDRATELENALGSAGDYAAELERAVDAARAQVETALAGQAQAAADGVAAALAAAERVGVEKIRLQRALEAALELESRAF